MFGSESGDQVVTIEEWGFYRADVYGGHSVDESEANDGRLIAASPEMLNWRRWRRWRSTLPHTPDDMFVPGYKDSLLAPANAAIAKATGINLKVSYKRKEKGNGSLLCQMQEQARGQ